MAVNNLVANGILKKVENKFLVYNLSFRIEKVKKMTLVEKIAKKLKKYINEHLQAGEKLPTYNFLTKEMNVSSKTIHDAINLLVKEGILCTRRGQYGTIFLGNSPGAISKEQYFYEKFEQKIRTYIYEKCQVGDKLPSIKEFALLYQTSEKTIKKALDNLAEDGYVTFVRGRYGGTFVTDIPQASNEAYKWLAITPEYITNMEN